MTRKQSGTHSNDSTFKLVTTDIHEGERYNGWHVDTVRKLYKIAQKSSLEHMTIKN